MRKELVILLVLLSVFLATGCAGNKSEAPNATFTPGTAGAETITVSAAASLTEFFTDITSQFEKEKSWNECKLEIWKLR